MASNVAMLIVMVSAAGVFAAQSSALEVRTSGFVRQASQTQYVSESGVVAALDRVRTDCRAYQQVIDRQVLMTAPDPRYAEQPRTYRFYIDDFITLTLPGTNGLFARPTPGGGGARIEGSFGPGNLIAGFVTAARLAARSTQPLPGYDVGGGRNYSPPILSVEFSSEGITRLQTSTGPRARDPRYGGNTEARLNARVLSQVPCI